MFSNFIFFFIALVIYTTSALFETTKHLDGNPLLYSLVITGLFVVICHIAFKRLEKISGEALRASIDQNTDVMVNTYISRFSFLALGVFAVQIYGLRLNHVFEGVRFFEIIPTAEAVLFLGLFLFYFIVIWNAAYQVQRRYFAGGVSKKEYVLSNVSFSLPALLPWFCLSLVADILGLIPWQPLKDLMESPLGEMGYVALFLVAIAIFGPLLIRRLWNCKPLEPGYERTRIESICRHTGLNYSDILKWELFGGTMLTAGVMGLLGRYRYILVTPALLTALNDDELDAVMLHEIGHVKNYHMLFYLFFFAGFIACNFVFFEPVVLLLYIAPVYDLFAFFNVGKNAAHSLLISVTLIGSFVLYFRFVFGFFMRNFERQADLHLYQYTHDAAPLITTFYKIASFSRQSIEKSNWHHFGIGQRIRFLKKCQEMPGLIQSHHKRVQKMVFGYFAIILILFGSGYSINYGMAKGMFETFVTEQVLFRQMDLDPSNSNLYALVGDYYYSKENYKKAIDSYENVLRVDAQNIHALNNLSWLLSTCPMEEYKDGEKALKYARRAITHKRESFILDTYAEALSLNNDIQNAVIIAKEALGRSKNKREYYKGQVHRFEEMLDP